MHPVNTKKKQDLNENLSSIISLYVNENAYLGGYPTDSVWFSLKLQTILL